MLKVKPTPVVVIFLTKEGVHEVQVHSPTWRAEPEGSALFERVRQIVDLLDRVAKEGLDESPTD